MLKNLCYKKQGVKNRVFKNEGDKKLVLKTKMFKNLGIFNMSLTLTPNPYT